ncbi:MAG: hypothetical protein IT439_06930 [Phycisphaerales bacterium]|nr:hypothetical protein [Phycisphaerales bacterium]
MIRFPTIAAMLWLSAFSASAMSTRAGCEPGLDRAAQLPESCSMVIAIDEARSLRGTESGEALAAALLDAPAASSLAGAWAVLAGELGLGPAEAFDALLGESVLVVFRGDPPESGEWALVTSVSDRTQRRVVEALRPRTREIKGGLPILSMERGQFVMAMRTARGAREAGEMVFAPSTSRGLFDDLCAFIARAPREATLAETPALVEARSLEAGPVLLLRRSEHAEFALTARPNGDGWAASFALRRTGALPQAPVRGPWTAPDLAALGEPAALAMVGDAALLRRATLLLAPEAQPDAPEPDEAGRLGALWMQRACGGESNFGQVSWAAEARDLPLAAVALDRRMAEAFPALTGRDDLRGPDFGGRALGSVRTAALSSRCGTLAWAAVPGECPTGGWLLVFRGPPGPSPALAVRRFGELLRGVCPEPQAPAPARLAGLIRPSLLPDWALAPEFTTVLARRAARRVREIRWDIADSGDRLFGEAQVQLAPVCQGK